MASEIADFAPFVAVARHRSFRKAADASGVTASAMSHAVRQIEERLKIRLFNRTTRSVSLTEAGRRLYDSVAPLFMDATEIIESLNALRDTPMGVIRINAVRTGARLRLSPLVGEFIRRYPDIRVEITLDDKLVDIVGEAYDAGIRLNNIIEKDMISLPVGPAERYAVVASPAYFATRPRPEQPADLLTHSCIQFRYPGGRPHSWPFGQGDVQKEIQVKGPIEVNDLDLALDLALQGSGVGYVLREMAEAFIRKGVLISVLEEWLPEQPGFYLYYSNRRHPSAAFRAFVDFLRENNKKASA